MRGEIRIIGLYRSSV